MNGHRRLLYQKHQTVVGQVVWSPDGHRLASVDVGGQALVWDGANG